MHGVMNKSELIEELSDRTGHNPRLTDQTVRIFFWPHQGRSWRWW